MRQVHSLTLGELCSGQYPWINASRHAFGFLSKTVGLREGTMVDSLQQLQVMVQQHHESCP